MIMELNDKELLVTGEDVIFNDDTSRKWLKGVLLTNVCTITFTKKDGTDRVMKCTLDPNALPPIQKEETEVGEVRQKSVDALAVFDVEKQEWRSFRYDSIKRFEMSIE